MSNGATDLNKKANSDYSGWEQSSMNKYQDAASGYASNVNSAIAAGNPYKSQDYLQNQNLQLSAANNAANTKAEQITRDTALRTGTNTAAVGAQVAENARAGQRQNDAYTAGQATANEDKWIQQSNQLRGEQLAGANSQLGAFGASSSGRSDALNNIVQTQGQDQKLWEAGIGAAGAAGAAAV